MSNYDELKNWYAAKNAELNEANYVSSEDANKHLDALGVPVDQSLYLLDISSGGHFLKEAMKRVACVGIEPTEKAIQFSQKLLGEATGTLLLAPIEEMRLYPVTFDYITAIGSLENVADIDAALQVIHVKLKAKGAFYAVVATAAPSVWPATFEAHGLIMDGVEQWNDKSAYVCRRGSLL